MGSQARFSEIWDAILEGWRHQFLIKSCFGRCFVDMQFKCDYRNQFPWIYCLPGDLQNLKNHENRCTVDQNRRSTKGHQKSDPEVPGLDFSLICHRFGSPGGHLGRTSLGLRFQRLIFNGFCRGPWAEAPRLGGGKFLHSGRYYQQSVQPLA